MSSPINLDSLLNYDPHMKSSQGKWDQRFERRRRPRKSVHWTIYLSRQFAAHPLESVTRDLSSSGFYCIVSEPFVPGEPLECCLLIPTHGAADTTVCLHGHVRVIRLENLGPEGFGIACAIESYRIAPFDEAQVRVEQQPVLTPTHQ